MKWSSSNLLLLDRIDLHAKIVKYSESCPTLYRSLRIKQKLNTKLTDHVSDQETKTSRFVFAILFASDIWAVSNWVIELVQERRKLFYSKAPKEKELVRR